MHCFEALEIDVRPGLGFRVKGSGAPPSPGAPSTTDATSSGSNRPSSLSSWSLERRGLQIPWVLAGEKAGGHGGPAVAALGWDDPSSLEATEEPSVRESGGVAKSSPRRWLIDALIIGVVRVLIHTGSQLTWSHFAPVFCCQLPTHIETATESDLSQTHDCNGVVLFKQEQHVVLCCALSWFKTTSDYIPDLNS
jgi:hypothetical protein